MQGKGCSIGIGLDEAQKLRNYARVLNINYSILHTDTEQQYTLLNQWGDPLGVLPFAAVIDRKTAT